MFRPQAKEPVLPHEDSSVLSPPPFPNPQSSQSFNSTAEGIEDFGEWVANASDVMSEDSSSDEDNINNNEHNQSVHDTNEHTSSNFPSTFSHQSLATTKVSTIDNRAASGFPDVQMTVLSETDDSSGSFEPREKIKPIAKPALQPRVPPLKRRRLDVSCRKQRENARAGRLDKMKESWDVIQKKLRSTKSKWQSGGLQERRTRAIECLLRLVIKNGRTLTMASRISAEAHRFSFWSGSRNLRQWTRKWIDLRELPTSARGRHAKVYSVISECDNAAELRAYLRSNKWAMNPEKLQQFTKGELIPAAANAYLKHVIDVEMPKGLKKYMDTVLFPRIQMKVVRGVSLSTARRWMRKEGFRFISHKKGLYFDGHDRPDVIDYRQKTFLPMMEKHAKRLVKYCPGDTEQEFLYPPENFVERRLVLCAHDEMTAQANDSPQKSWVLNDEHSLRKKGVGRGVHQSDIICSTVGWLRDASQTLEYGKNYEGYWTGELFIKQVSFISLFVRIAS